jgi:ketosteroid isomerase-like protein
VATTRRSRTTSIGSTDPRAVALGYLASFVDGDPADHVTEGFVNEHTAALGSGCVGRDEYRRRVPGFLAEFEGLRYEPEDVAVDGDRVVVAYRMTATYAGRPIDLRGCMWFRVEGAEVAHRIDYWDALTFQQQAGLV